MSANDPLQRAPLKRAGLALLAALACTAPAAAQTLSIADTLAYINEYCDGHKLSDRVVTVTTGRVTSTGSQVSINNELEYLNSERAGFRTSKSFDLRQVDIEKEISTHPSKYGIKFTCLDGNCISWSTRFDGQPEGDKATNSITHIDCREPDRVASAFKRLQQLVGGRIFDLIDPFEN
jgi:hypothetical protein